MTRWSWNGMSYASRTNGVCRRYTPEKYVTCGLPVRYASCCPIAASWI